MTTEKRALQTFEVEVTQIVRVTLDPRSFADGGLVHALTWGAAEEVKYAAASVASSLDYLLSQEITTTEAIQRLREMRRVRAQAAALARIEPKQGSDL